MAQSDTGGEPRGSPLARIVLWIDIIVCRTVEWVAMLLMAIYTSLCFYQVIARFVLNSPASWTEQATRALMIWSVYLGSLALFRHGLLISVDFVQGLAHGWFRHFLSAVHFFSALAILTVTAFYGFELAQRVRFQMLAGLEISVSWAYLAIPVGALLCIFGLVAHHIELLRHPEDDVGAGLID